jgi:hypothetical protein
MQNTNKHEHTITNIIKKLQHVLHKFRYANKLLPTHTMKQQYYSLAYPHLIGAISVWGTNKPNSSRLQPLIRTQKKLVRLIANRPPGTHARPLMIAHDLLSVPDLYTLRVCAEMHAYIYPPKPTNRPENNHRYVSTAQIHEYPTRHSQQLHHYIPNRRENPRHTMEHFTRKYTQVWNTVPQEIRERQSLQVFKKDLTIHLLEMQKRAELSQLQ